MTMHEDREAIERMKQSGGNVTVGGVRFAPAPKLDEAYELGRRRENERDEHVRAAIAQIRSLMWRERPNQPGLETRGDMNAIVDAVRVLVESVQAYDIDRNGLRQQVAQEQARFAEYLRDHQEDAAKVRDLTREVERLKGALAGQHNRGYEAALKDVRTAARHLREEREED